VQPQFPTLPGPITSISQKFVNLGETKIQGFDVDIQAKLPPTDFGRFSASLTGTYYIQYDQQNSDGSFTGFVSNQYGATNTGLTPRWKHYLALNWTYGPWSTTVGQTFQTGYIDGNLDADGENTRRVGSLSIWDLQGVYTGFKNWTLTLGVKNLLDRDPPLSNQTFVFISGFDPSYYDPRARFVYGTVKYTFK